MSNGFLRMGAPCVLAFVLAGCSSSDLGLDFNFTWPTNLTGWWRVNARETGSGDPYEAQTLTQMSQTGSTLESEGHAWVVSDSTVTAVVPNEFSPDRQVWYLNIVDDDLLEGVVQQFRTGLLETSQDIRFVRVNAPDGTLVASGTVDGNPVDLDRTTGFAVLELDPGVVDSSRLTLCDSQPATSLDVVINFDGTLSPFGAASYDVAPWPNEVNLWVTTESGSESALSGTVTFTAFDAGHARGSGTVALESGATFTFEFDVDIAITH